MTAHWRYIFQWRKHQFYWRWVLWWWKKQTKKIKPLQITCISNIVIQKTLYLFVMRSRATWKQASCKEFYSILLIPITYLSNWLSRFLRQQKRRPLHIWASRFLRSFISIDPTKAVIIQSFRLDDRYIFISYFTYLDHQSHLNQLKNQASNQWRLFSFVGLVEEYWKILKIAPIGAQVYFMFKDLCLHK